MDRNAKIFIAGHQGNAASALVKSLKQAGYWNLVIEDPSRLDLCNQSAVKSYFEAETPDCVFVTDVSSDVDEHGAPAKPADLLADRIESYLNIMRACHHADVQKCFMVASSSVYATNAHEPCAEDALFSGILGTSFDFRSLANITGIRLCEAFNSQYDCNYITLITPELYGDELTVDTTGKQIINGLIRSIIQAKNSDREFVELAGTGLASPEFIHGTDFAEACAFLLDKDDCPPVINVGTGDIMPLQALAIYIKNFVGYEGELHFNQESFDTTQYKVMDSSLIRRLGWAPRVNLLQGLKDLCVQHQHARKPVQPRPEFITP